MAKTIVTQHAKQRIQERNESVTSLEGLELWEEAEFDLTFNLFWESANRSW